MKGDIDGKFFFAYYLLKDASFLDKPESYMEALNHLIEITYLEPERPDAYYYIGFLYENGIRNKKKF